MQKIFSVHTKQILFYVRSNKFILDTNILMLINYNKGTVYLFFYLFRKFNPAKEIVK